MELTGLPRDLQVFIMGKVDVMEHLKALTTHLSVVELRELYAFVNRQEIATQKATMQRTVALGDHVELTWLRCKWMERRGAEPTVLRGVVLAMMENRFLFKADAGTMGWYTDRRQVRYNEISSVRKLNC